MSSPIIHIGVALVALLLYFNDRQRMWALFLLFFAVLPDLDHYTPFYAPRMLFHTVFLLLPLLFIALIGLATKRTLLRDVGLMSSFCLFSHLVLDFFSGGGGQALFYPLSRKEYAFYGSSTLAQDAVAILPKSLLPYASYEVIGIVLISLALGGILIFKKLLELSTDVPERADKIEV